jgi:putative ABC transport system permease protein
MNAILRFWAIFVVTLKRLVAQRGLALATLLGIFVAVALTMSIPIYADGIYQRILNTAVKKGTEYNRPPYAFMYRHIGSWSGPVKLDQLAPVDSYLSGSVASQIGLPVQTFVRYLKSDTMRLYPRKEGLYTGLDKPLEWISFGAVNDLQKHIQILEGSYPDPSPADTQSAVDVMISETLATSLGLQVGESYVAYGDYKADQTTITSQIPLRIVGIWKPNDPNDTYWFYSVDELRSVLIIPEDTFKTRITSVQGDTVYLVVWYWLFDGSHVHSSEVASLLGRIAASRARAVNLLPTARLDISPENVLQQFQKSANSLTVFLYAFSIPILGMTFTFIGLIVDMVVGQRRNEIAVLRSRGATIVQIIGMAALESTLLGLVGLAAGAPGAASVASFFGRAISFLNFSAHSDINTDITLNSVRIGAIAVIISLAFMVLPSIGAARHTIITYKQDRARSLRRSWWQRIWLDVLLLIPAGYGMYLMKQQGGLLIPGQDSALAADPFQNPLLLLVPALAIFALTLLLLRILPLLMGLVSWVASKTNSVGLLMASRYLSRTSGGYNAPLILLVLTLSLSTFTASLAQTLDRHVHDQTYYKVGADMSVVEMGQSTQPSSGPSGSSSTTTTTTTSDTSSNLTQSEPQWLFLPVTDHLRVPGVTAAARVLRTVVTLTINGDSLSSDFIGVDRVDFSRVSYWRRDFAPQSLGYLMNDLGRTTEGVLVSREVLAKGVRLGDNLRASVFENSENTNIDYKVVGVFDYFPTWYPGEKPLVVGNLDYYFEAIGGENPYDVWLKLSPSANTTTVRKGVEDLYQLVLDSTIASEELYAAQSRPERQGFFGLLSVGFAALALLTVLGFLLYALFSFRRRFIELGMLRAIGLSAFQMIVFLGSELAFLFIVGLGAGTGLGVWVSNFFIPQLQVGNGMAARVPPFLVQIDWPSVFQIYILFGLLFVVAMVILSVMLLRMKIFQAIKLGEAI